MAKPKPLKVNKAKATKTSNGKKNNKPAKKAAVKGAEVLMLATEANDAEVALTTYLPLQYTEP